MAEETKLKNIAEYKDKLKEWFSWDKIQENLPAILAIGGCVLLLDKLLDLSTKLKPVYKKVKELNKNEIFETIDTGGDQIQFLSKMFTPALKLLKIEVDETQWHALADFLQNVGTAGKDLGAIIDLFKGKIGKYRETESTIEKYKS